jgi:hypothetical protein
VTAGPVTGIRGARGGAWAHDARWLALFILCLGELMIVLDVTIVGVALPSIRADLGFSEASLAWVINAYLITFGGFLLLGGRLGDLLGNRTSPVSLSSLPRRRCAALPTRRGCWSRHARSRGSAGRSSRRFPSR